MWTYFSSPKVGKVNWWYFIYIQSCDLFECFKFQFHIEIYQPWANNQSQGRYHRGKLKHIAYWRCGGGERLKDWGKYSAAQRCRSTYQYLRLYSAINLLNAEPAILKFSEKNPPAQHFKVPLVSQFRGCLLAWH